MGVATVSFYLRHNDIPNPDLSLFKANYIYTGLVVMGFFALAGALLYLCIAITTGWGSVPAMLIIFFSWSTFFILLPYVLILQLKTGETGGSSIVVALELGALSLASIGLGIVVFKVFGPSAEERAGAFLLAIFAIGLVLWYISIYSRHIYPELPDQFGGGRPKQARLLFSATGAAEVRQLGVPLEGDTQMSRPVTLLLTGEQFYAVRIPDGRIVQVANDDVVGLEEDSTAPHVVDVEAYNRGKVAGLPEPGDRLVLTFSEEMDPTTLIPHWSGRAIDAAIALRPDSEGVGDLKFLTSDHTALPDLGYVEMRSGQYARLFRSGTYPVTIEEKGAEILVTLDAQIGQRRWRASKPDVMAWIPSPQATDMTGNPCLGTGTIEAGSDDPDQADADF